MAIFVLLRAVVTVLQTVLLGQTHRLSGPTVQGMVVVAAVSTAVAIGVAMLSVFMLRTCGRAATQG